MPRGLAGAAAGKVRLCSGLVFCPAADGEERVAHFCGGKMALGRRLPKVSKVWSLRHCECLFPGSGVTNGSVEDQEVGFCFLPRTRLLFFFREGKVLFSGRGILPKLWNCLVKGGYFYQPGWWMRRSGKMRALRHPLLQGNVHISRLEEKSINSVFPALS